MKEELLSTTKSFLTQYPELYDQLRNTMTGGIGLSTFFSKENFEKMFPPEKYNYNPDKQQSLPRNSYTFKSDTKTGKKCFYKKDADKLNKLFEQGFENLNHNKLWSIVLTDFKKMLS